MAKGPSYYQRGSYDVWDFIREQGLNFHLGNAIKYICRAGYKDSTTEDLEKAIHYLENELTYVKNFRIRSSQRVSYEVQHPKLTNIKEAILSEEFDR